MEIVLSIIWLSHVRQDPWHELGQPCVHSGVAWLSTPAKIIVYFY